MQKLLQQGHAGCKTLLQENPPVLDFGCRLMQVVLYNGCKMVVVVVVVVATDRLITFFKILWWTHYKNVKYCKISVVRRHNV